MVKQCRGTPGARRDVTTTLQRRRDQATWSAEVWIPPSWRRLQPTPSYRAAALIPNGAG
jgi:hypothetical protein